VIEIFLTSLVAGKGAIALAGLWRFALTAEVQRS
jgi:hypothetical protein